MKRAIIKSVAVLTAFFIGVSINNSCGESTDYGQNGTNNGSTENQSTGSLDELWSKVSALSDEIESLKSDNERMKTEIETLNEKITSLESESGGGNGSGSGETFVDGLYFGRDGLVSSKPKIVTIYNSDGTANSINYITYDSQGRIKSKTSDLITIVYTSDYVYSGKQVTINTEEEIISTGAVRTSSSVYEYE